MSEQWLPVVGFEGSYEVSDLGRVRSRFRVLKHRIDTAGRPRVNLSADGVHSTHIISILVAVAFVSGRASGLIVEHQDGNPANNAATNLRWATQSANARNRHRTQAASGVIGLDFVAKNRNRPWRARAMTRDKRRIVQSFSDRVTAEDWLRDIRAENFHD